MRLIFIFFSPLLLSSALYLVSWILAFDYCGYVEKALVIMHFSGVHYFKGDLTGCLSYGALVVVVLLFLPLTAYIYLALDVERVLKAGIRVDINKTFFASFIILAVYLSIFFVPIDAYSSRGAAAAGLIFGQPILFYLFLVFPCQILSGLWVLCIKTRLIYSNGKRK